MKKIAVLALAVLLIGSVTAYADGPGPTSTWSYTSYHGSYTPLNGAMTSYYYTNTQYMQYFLWTQVDFSVTSHNVASILDYMDGGADYPGTTWDGRPGYLTLDVTNVPDAGERLNANTIVSNLPDPKYDLESDQILSYNEESEVVAQALVQTGVNYYVKTYWDDFRRGITGDSGHIEARFGISILNSADYNTMWQSDVNQAVLNYGKYQNRP